MGLLGGCFGLPKYRGSQGRGTGMLGMRFGSRVQKLRIWARVSLGCPRSPRESKDIVG